MVYEAPGSPLHPHNDPSEVFDALFAGAAPTADPGVDLPTTLADAEQSILDAHVAELGALMNAGSTEDRRRLQQHLDGIRTIEGDLARLRDGSVAVGVCSPPDRVAPSSVTGAADYDLIARSHADIIGRAFACDITRVATLQLFYDAGSRVGLDFLESRSPGISNKSIHDNKHDAGAHSHAIDDWYSEIVAHLLEQLDVPDPLDPMGGRILDNTVLLFGSNLHYPSHGAGPNYGRYGGRRRAGHDRHGVPDRGLGGGLLQHRPVLRPPRSRACSTAKTATSTKPATATSTATGLLVSMVNAFGIETSTKSATPLTAPAAPSTTG